MTLFLVASIAVLLTHDSANSANTSNRELEAARADYVAAAGLQHALWQTGNNACMGDVTIPTTTLGTDSYTATISGAAAGTAYTLTVDQDAWIRDDDVTKNNGTNADQHIRFESGMTEHALTRFDISSLPAGAQINTAVAWFYVSTGGASGGIHPDGPLTVHRVVADWTETGATWETMGGNFENTILTTIPAQPTDGVWVNFNLTGQVQAWVNGQPNYGILMASTAEGVHGKYASREDGGNTPRLEVVVGSGPASPVTIQTTGTLANGVTRTLSRPLTGAYQPPIVHTFSPGPTESEDAEIYDQAPDDNYGDAAETWVSSASGDTTRSLLRFNMGAIPAGARILGATLSLHHKSGSGADQPVSAHRIMNPWSEDAVTWNSRESGTNWDTAGGDFDSVAVATTPVGPANEGYEWDITPLVQGWVDGSYPNYGVALTAAIDGMPGEEFHTSDQATLDIRPGLTVTYACECGTACMSPQSNGKVLMVVSDATNPVAEDTYKKDLIESWGYTVTFIQDDDSHGQFNSGTQQNDVIFISETIDSTVLDTKLGNPTIGIVNTEGWMNDELGFESANSSNWPVGDSITVTDTSHYITAPFAAGSLDIYDVSMGGLGIGGTPAAGAQLLADWSTGAGLVTLDTGATTAGGTSTAGRRVMLPFGRAVNVNWTEVNNNGHLILQRSLDWGMGVGNIQVGNLLMVVGNDGNLTSQEQAKTVLLESWGYTVNVIDEDDSQGDFNTALTANDVVFVTEDVNAGDVGNKLTAATIGAVIEEDNLAGELGFSGGINWDSGTNFDIDNTHYITSTLATGDVALLSSFESLATLTGTIAADIQVLGYHDGLISLAALDGGAALSGGGSAAGRRVILPWGGSDMDVGFLNADGLTVFRRALEWGAGAGCGSSISLLLVVSDAGSPSSQEAARQNLMESWCYNVTLIDDDATSGEFATAMALNDVIYVSQEVTTLTVANKLKDAPIGIVNEEYLISSGLGFGSGTGTGLFSDINLVNNTHYITSEFNLGAIALFDPAYDLYTGTGFTLAPDLIMLGEAGSITGLMALETGGALWDAGNAPARRVQVPWGDDFSALNTDGQTIMQRAIEWAVGAGANPMAPIAHWKLDETSGTTAVDSVGGHDGALANGPTWTAGTIDGALEFDGSNDYVNVPHDDTLSLTSWSISAWLYPTGLGGWQSILFKGTQNNNVNYYLGTNDDEIDFGFYNGSWEMMTTSSVSLSNGQWYQVVVTFDNTSDEGKAYLNGTLVLTESTGNTTTPNTDALTIGRDQWGEYWDGLLDDVRLYDRVLTASEITDLAAGGGGGGGGGGPSGYFDEFNSRDCAAADYAGTDGSLDWSPWSWTETSESNGSCSGLIQVADDPAIPDPGSFRLMLDERNHRFDRLMDLSGFTTATLSFDYRLYNYPTSSDVFVVIASSDGTNWQKLAAFAGPVSQSDYQTASFDITPFIGTNSGIGFITEGKNTIQTLYIDNVHVFGDGGGGGGGGSGCDG
ncbi:MAG: DNRLRE domain-containing protein, partial [Gammaproteobacteria bacterium]|nr:DNRLRE domain-containing protein [Gammaproteobacteria bacterium]